jgi:hydroxymethylglutaryl-CoA reductase (NADPH)
MTKAESISIRNIKTAAERRVFLEKSLKVKLSAISQTNFTETNVEGRNIENLIGATQIPLGIAGPLSVRHSGERSDSRIIPKADSGQARMTKEYFIPLATTEGALVASISRGCKAISQSGGAIVALNTVGMTRGPVFRTRNITHSHITQKLIQKNLAKLQKTAQSTSSHLKLLKIDVNFVGKNLYCRMYFDTSDAMGMNMATFAAEVVCQAIEKLTEATLISLAGNYDTDKKPSWLNFINGRGKQAWAEITITKNTVRETLKTTPEKIVNMVRTKQHLGSIMSGSMGYNAHFANIIAAIFIATGQDPAHVVEGSLGVTTAEVEPNGNLYFSVYLPSLILGSVGGGTSLPTQKEALNIIGAKNAEEFAKVVAAAVLAGELSLTASLAEGSLARAHKKLARSPKASKSQ